MGLPGDGNEKGADGCPPAPDVARLERPDRELAFLLDLGLGHGKANAFKQLEDGEAIPERVDDVEDQHAAHEPDVIRHLHGFHAVEVVAGFHGAAQDLVNDLGLGDQALLLQFLDGGAQHIPPGRGGLDSVTVRSDSFR